MFEKLFEWALGQGPSGVVIAFLVACVGGLTFMIRTLYKDLNKAHADRASLASDCASAMATLTATITALERTVVLIGTGAQRKGPPP